MTAHDPRVTLTEAEREELAPFDEGYYSCACGPRLCASLPCDNDRIDLARVVADLIAARLAPIRAVAEQWDTGCAREVLDALDATGADLSASHDHDGAERQP